MAKKQVSSNLFSLEDFFQTEKMIIPFSPSIDLIAGGGLVEGTWNIFVGEPKVGKTTAIMHFAAKCQRPEYGGRKVFYCNIENRFKKRDAYSIPGLDVSKFFVISSSKEEKDEEGETTAGKILSAEQHLTELYDCLKDNPGSIGIVDSESALCTEAEMAGAMNEMQRADGAKLMSKFIRKVSPIINVNNNIILSVRHIMSNPGGYGAPTKEKGSNAGSYQVDFKLRAEKKEKWEVNEKPIGQIVTWRLETGYLDGAIPSTSIKSYIRYGFGIDESYELMQLGIDFALIEKSASWYQCIFGKNHPELGDWTDKSAKFQGEEKLYQFLKANPNWFNALNSDLKKLLK